MKTTYEDPLIPPHETSDETLMRLSANIGTLTGLMDAAGRGGHYALDSLFNRARDARVAQAEEIIAWVTAGAEESVGDRRFQLVRCSAPVSGAPLPSRRTSVRSPVPLALTQ